MAGRKEEELEGGALINWDSCNVDAMAKEKISEQLQVIEDVLEPLERYG